LMAENASRIAGLPPDNISPHFSVLLPRGPYDALAAAKCEK
jgi:hypothetical protein